LVLVYFFSVSIRVEQFPIAELHEVFVMAEVVQKLKANSWRWLGENSGEFEWQKGYGAFSVSPSLSATVQDYIRNQADHRLT
jgi:putative transposase